MKINNSYIGNQDRVGRLTAEIQVLVKRTAEDIIEIGRRLIEIKSILGHGQFGDWLQAEFGWTHQTANNFMNVAERFSENPKFLEFSPSVLYLLASNDVPQTALNSVINRSEAGEHITTNLAKTIIQQSRLDDRLNNIEQHTPEIIHRMLENGVLSVHVANNIAEQLKKVVVPVYELVAKWGISDPEVIPILERLFRNKSEAFDELSLSGYIQPGEEEKAIPLHSAKAGELQAYLDTKRREHVLQSIVQRQSELPYVPTVSPRLVIGFPSHVPEIEDESIDLIILSTPETELEVLKEMFRVATSGASLFLHFQPQSSMTVNTYFIICGVELSQTWNIRQEIIWDSGRAFNLSRNYFYPVDEHIYWLTKGEPTLPKSGLRQASIWRPYNPDNHYLPLSADELTRRALEAVGRAGITVLFPDSGNGKSLDLAFGAGCNAVGIVNSAECAEKFKNKFRWPDKLYFSGQTGT